MIDVLFSSPILFVIIALGLVLAITIHEFAHAFIADKLGDPTPRYQGRVTLNPLAHLDPLGTIAILLTRFGWGKPVQYDPYNLKEPVRDTALIALAGPMSNLILASLLSILIHVVTLPEMVVYGIIQIMIINVMLALFNLVPVHPLDGGKIILTLLPKKTAYEYESFMQRYGILVLLLLIFPLTGGASPVSRLISPVINVVMNLLLW